MGQVVKHPQKQMVLYYMDSVLHLLVCKGHPTAFIFAGFVLLAVYCLARLWLLALGQGCAERKDVHSDRSKQDDEQTKT